MDFHRSLFCTLTHTTTKQFRVKRKKLFVCKEVFFFWLTLFHFSHPFDVSFSVPKMFCTHFFIPSLLWVIAKDRLWALLYFLQILQKNLSFLSLFLTNSKISWKLFLFHLNRYRKLIMIQKMLRLLKLLKFWLQPLVFQALGLSPVKNHEVTNVNDKRRSFHT